MRRVRLLLLVVPLVAAACSSSARSADPRRADAPATVPMSTAAPGPTTPAFPVDPVRWTPCPDGTDPDLTCASVEVPLDHTRPDGRRITLALARRAASASASDRIGTVFVNPGGPGASGVRFLRGFAPGPLDDRFDVVSWDPRGVGVSTAVDCDRAARDYRGLDWSPDTEAERAALDEGASAIATDCAATDRELLAHLSTDDTARDLDLLRRAVGDGQLTYVGFSYGTAIGQAYARLFPTTVRAMVLDGVVDPRDDLGTLLGNQTRSIETEWAAVNDSCARACPVADATAAFDAVAARVERTERTAPTTGLSPARLAFSAIFTTYDPALRADYLRGLADARRGADGRLVALADGYFGLADYDAYVATLCLDGPRPDGAAGWDELAAELAAVSPRFGAAVANEVRPCATWPVPPTGRPGPVAPEGLPPVLVVGGTGDPATPFAQAEAVAAMLPGARLLTSTRPGHVAFGRSACVREAVADYLGSGVLPASGASCD